MDPKKLKIGPELPKIIFLENHALKTLVYGHHEMTIIAEIAETIATSRLF